MPKPSRLALAKPQILSYFNTIGPRVYREAELAQLLASEGPRWNLAASTKVPDFIRFLEQNGSLKTVCFQAEAYQRVITRYVWGRVSPYLLALSLRSKAYLSHGTAAFLQSLIKTKPRLLYLNVEQSLKPQSRNSLTQEALNRAFARQQRQSKYVFKYGVSSVMIIAGKHSNQLGVESLAIQNGESLQITNTERTLIDITVRPAYCGGIEQVLKAYRSARDNVSTDRLLSILDQLDYVYPYHQAVGFLLQAAGYKTHDYSKFRTRVSNHDFFIMHAMNDPVYSENWKLFFPRNLRVSRSIKAGS